MPRPIRSGGHRSPSLGTRLTGNSPREGGYSLAGGIRGCSKVLGCFFVIFGILNGGFPFRHNAPKVHFGKFGQKAPNLFEIGWFLQESFCSNLVY